MVACNKNEIDVQRFQVQLASQEQKADELLDEISKVLQSNTPESVTRYAGESQLDIVFYIFNRNELLFWTSNKVAIDEISIYTEGKWFYQKFENAHSICRWSRVGHYHILTIAPIKFSYKHETQNLQNKFVDAFDLPNNININLDEKSGNAIYSSDNRYLFSLYVSTAQQKQKPELLTRTFSYSQILNPEGNVGEKYLSQVKIRFYFMCGILLCVVLFILIAYRIYKYKGFKNLTLNYRYGIVFIALFIISLISIFFISVVYVREQYESRQKKVLEQKTQYIQKTLQEIYYWNLSLDASNRQSLNIELRDLSFTYQTDIHVYDRNGVLVGSSQPLLFSEGFLSKRMSSKPYFSKNTKMILTEEIGDFEYISAYTDFCNGDYMPLGYIAVPLFISADEIAAEIDELLSRLIPIYFVIIFLYIILSMVLGRQIVAPIKILVATLDQFRLDQHNEKIYYQPHDEIGLLVEQYNKLVDQLEESAQLLAQSERENAWKTMARQIAHEINNPLTPMKLSIQQLQRVKKLDMVRFEDSFDNASALLIEQIDNLSRIAATFSNFAKIPEIKLTGVDIANKLNSVVSLFANNTENVSLTCHGTQNETMVTTDAEQIIQVFNNLIKNAIQAVAGVENGAIIVDLKEKAETVEIRVSDNGCGISCEIREKIFQPNFTTKNTGMGLGLVISKNIVESSGGKIEFYSEEGQGTTFIVELLKHTNK